MAERVREKLAAEQRKQKSLAAMRELSELSQKLGLSN
ncbi:putative Shikimate kinase [Klebsiella michiganensis]|uniref:Putative Shikimate kinase n=1 Tax=Klebsiella michiganensis TaxID=1134687 RepID=A0A7H4PF73_9ENTR|nr:putative Shikimate kinase [Klebsiella michiganensis]